MTEPSSDGAGLDATRALIARLVECWAGLPDSGAEALDLLGALGTCGDVRGVAAVVPFAALPDDPDADLPWHVRARNRLTKSVQDRSALFADLRSTARTALTALVQGVRGGDWLVFDEMARRNTYSSFRSREHWEALEPPILDALPDDDGRRYAWLALLSCHPNGYVREGAFLRLAGEYAAQAYPIALIRANDWVAAIRVIAMEAVRETCERGEHRVVVDNLSLLLRLESCGREPHGALIEDALTDLITGGVGALHDGLVQGSVQLRRCIIRIADRVAPASRLKLVEQAAEDEDLLVRMWAVRSLDGVAVEGPEAVARLRARFLHDPAGAIRRIAIEHAVRHDVASAWPTLEACLLDTSGSVRHVARFYLTKAGREIDYAAHYRKALGGPTKRFVAAVSGLAETGRVEDADGLEHLLDHSASKVVRAVLKALHRLDEEGTRTRRVEAILHASANVRREALRTLGRRLRDADAETLCRLVPQADNERQVGALVEAAERLKAWPRLHTLLVIVHRVGEDCRSSALVALADWRPTDDVLYSASPPTREQTADIKAAFLAARTILTLPVRVALERAIGRFVAVE